MVPDTHMMDKLVSGIDALANTMDKVGLGFDDSVLLVNANVNWRERGREGEREGERERDTNRRKDKETDQQTMLV